MANETGDPSKPYMGKNGRPRKTPPPGHPDRNKRRNRRQADNVVEAVFGEEARQQAEEAAAPATFEPTGKAPKVRKKKVKLSGSWSRALEIMAAEGMTMEEFIATLSPEELARGQLKNERGSFVGAPAKWVPAEFHKACIRELLKRGKQLYQESYLEAIQTMLQVANSPSVEPAQRIKAAQFVIERIEGKVPERLEVGVSEPWQEILSGIVASPGAPMRPFPSPAGAAPQPDDDL